jgi:SAM-dependent methyltransferase
MPGGLIGQLFLRLHRFELHRVDAAFVLLGPGQRLVDIGCGDGMLLSLARQRFPAVYGLDLASVVVHRARATCLSQLGYLQGVTLLQADANRRFPFGDGTVDAVAAVAVLEHIFDPYHLVTEVNRILRPGGQFVVEVPNIAWLPRRWELLLGRLPVTGDEDGWDGGHLHYFTFHALEQLLRDHGFVIERAESTGVFAPIRNVWPSLLGGNIVVKARKAAG